MADSPSTTTDAGVQARLPGDPSMRPATAPGDPGMRPATPADLQGLKTVLAEAFFDDPMFGWLIPEESKRHARLRRYFGVDLRYYVLPRGRVWTTADLTGASLTLPPGKWRVPPHATLLQGTAFGPHILRAAKVGAAMEWRHSREIRGPHYYVRDIGVHPSMQGKGLGSALMCPTLDRCDREGLPAYIEASSERSAALYERLGFQHTKELRVGGSPPLWLMIRQPQPVQADS